MRNRITGAMAMLVGITLMIGWVLPGPVHGYQPFMTAAQVPYNWNLSALPSGTITWQVSASAPSIAHDSMVACTQIWTDATGGTLKFAEGPGGITVDWDPNGAMIVDPTFLAYTTFNADATNHIASAHLIVNANNYNWQRGGYGGVGAPGADGKRMANLDSVVLHELGHALGLDHSDKNPTAIVGPLNAGDPPTMNSVIYPNAGTLHSDDLAGIRALYESGAAPASSPLTLSATPASGNAPLKTMLTVTGGDQSTFWDFGDGSNVTGLSPLHLYTAAGTYTVTATCGKCSATMTIQVNKKGTKAPKALKPKKQKKAKNTPTQNALTGA